MFNFLPLLMAFELNSANVAAITLAIVALFFIYKIVRKMWKYPVVFMDSQTNAVIKEKSCKRGTKIKLEPAVKNGETFVGWSYTRDGSKPCTGKHIITEGKTTIYAMWDKPIAKEVISLEDANMYIELAYADEAGNIMRKETLPLVVNAPRTYNDYGRFKGWKKDDLVVVPKHYDGSTVSVTLYPVFSGDVGIIEKEEENVETVDSFSAVDANMYIEFKYNDLDGNGITDNLMPIVATFPKVFDDVVGFEGWAFEPNGAIEVDKDFVDSVISFELVPAGLEDIHKSATVAAPVVEEVVEEPAAEEVVEEPVAEEVAEEPVAEEVAEEPVAEEVVEEPAAEEVAEEPVAEEVVEEPVAEEVVEEPAAEETVEEPVAEETVEEPVAEEVAEEPAAEEVVEEPVAEEVVEEPAAEEVVEEPVAEEVAEEPVAEEVVEEPVAEEVVEEPAAEEVAEEPVAEEV
ncbi:MAG: InlB B-repeat-containing protein, partial [Clostridia bacterium]|nr:InlB B-repeat-containing protein [Clostridia bacterium]